MFAAACFAPARARLLFRFGLGACALALAAPTVSGQAQLVRSGGALGGTLTYAISGQPLQFYALVPSLTTGPTPLALLEPSDPRVLNVGLDLSATWRVGPLGPSGTTLTNYALPLSSALQGLVLYAQAVTLPGTSGLFDDLTQRTSLRLALPGSAVFTVGAQPASRTGHGSSLLPDGSVLLSGGVDANGGATLDGFARFDPQTQEFAALAGAMQHPRSAHSATRLLDGRVLLVGGVDENGAVVATADVWNPLTGTCTPAASLPGPRAQHTATLLGDGRVLVVGGVSNFDLADPLAALGSALSSCVLYDPLANAWNPAPSLPKPRVGHAASLVGNGRALVSCGIEITNVLGFPVPGFSSDCRRYDPVANSWSAAGTVSGGRAFHAQTTLTNGRALLVGGVEGNLLTLVFTTLATTRVYDPSANSWANTASLAGGRAYPQLVAASGRAIVLGGLASFDLATQSGAPALAIESALETVAAWSSSADLQYARPVCSAIAIEGGARVLVTGTGDDGQPTADLSAEIYLP